MPVYVYKCHNCKKTFEKRHGMFFEQRLWIHCISDDIFKVPSVEYTGKSPESRPKKTGKIVDEYIKDVKEEVKKEKDSLRKRKI